MAAALTSVSIATGTPNASRNGDRKSVSAQPGFGVDVIQPNRGEAGSRSTGPKVPMPSAAMGPKAASCFRKKAMARPMVSNGVVVGIRSSASTTSGPRPTAQRNFVPPASMPP
jgi:hypothetical protein